ncbi:SHOCT domain-containing protein [Halorhabdus sp. CBA1104]|uniref:SHOCT domain-containing protein n=1 Tax=unclassified Halorhabdus TaxID=2621901 RepID=UPI0012B20BE4|nr:MULTISPECIES: SHOCT domain-containing protein [unclassified Halorhabdus]QGN06450.1 SHOCT domain-containing protein [Halorhabdus sp. CBA1104]
MPSSDRLDATTVALLILGALVVVPTLTMGGGFGGMAGHGGMMDGYASTGGWWALVGMFVRLAVLLAVLGGGYVFFHRMTESQASRNPPMEELRMAYARGEISEDAFEERRTKLERSE